MGSLDIHGADSLISEQWFDASSYTNHGGHRMAPADAEAAVANFCAHTDDVLFSSSPFDFAESTHVNVRPPVTPLAWISRLLGRAN